MAEILKKVVEKFSAKMCSDEFFLKHALERHTDEETQTYRGTDRETDTDTDIAA